MPSKHLQKRPKTNNWDSNAEQTAHSGKQQRKALITIWDKEVDVSFDEETDKYLCVGTEICPHTKKEHRHVYWEGKTKRRMGFFTERFGKKIWLSEEIQEGNGNSGADAAAKYPLKDESMKETQHEWGERIPAQKDIAKRASNKAAQEKEEWFTELHEKITAANSWGEVLKMYGVHKFKNWALEVFNSRPILGMIDLPEELREWQSNAITKLLKQNNRMVDVYVDYQGGMGKTVLAKELVVKHGAFYCSAGKTADIVFAYDNQPIVVFDLARNVDEQYWPYAAIEIFKNGFGFCPKYQSTTKVFKPCKVIVFTNQDPDESKLSKDRWNITILNELFNYTPDTPALKKNELEEATEGARMLENLHCGISGVEETKDEEDVEINEEMEQENEFLYSDD